ncbi:MAG: bifunctional nuclease family protein [Flavobacteriales bacterium]|nr:bifunctional nuclease family protein [Flavobacteriales bacterium]
MKKVRLNIVGLSYSQTQSGAYALVLSEEQGHRRLPIIIGGFEAQSIAIALEKDVIPPRPLTHDLFKQFADEFRIGLKEVLIHKLQDGVFFASLVCLQNDEEVTLDARTSDAVALAVRFGCPIYTYEEILKAAGIILEEETPTEEKQPSEMEEAIESEKEKVEGHFSGLNDHQLQSLMQDAIEKEDYEKAAAIRDELEKRKKN